MEAVEHAVDDGASTTPEAITRTSPLYKAYAPANSFPPGVLSGSSGPIPERIMDALANASIHPMSSVV